jgi:hypothetical protein
MTRRNLAALVFVAAGLTAAAGIDAQQQAALSTTVQQPPVRAPGPVKPPTLLKQFVGSGRWRSQRSMGSLTDPVNDSMRIWGT